MMQSFGSAGWLVTIVSYRWVVLCEKEVVWQAQISISKGICIFFFSL